MSKRGRLNVLLGAAPGVGKTFAMLEEGRRLLGEGKDVIIGIVETHGREATAAMTVGLPVIPRALVEHRGVALEELDLAAVLAHHPEIALIDELAHTNAPGSAHAKRWEDVEALLAAGIDVISTLNIQHIESLNDVVEQITGIPQRETVPDSFLREADSIEVIDLAPQALRDRLSSGVVYPAERIDAALSNYFRLGNLTALRELALIWLADEVDQALRGYRAAHGINRTWEARERVVVALTGGPEGETLLRRGARIASRSAGGELLAVHVTTQDGLRASNPAELSQQRRLVEKLNGSYHQVIGDDVPGALVEFARSVNATQLVLGASRRGRLAAVFTGSGIGATVVRESGDIDVHMVNHAAAGKRFSLPPRTGALTMKRRLLGLAVALIGGPLLTLLLATTRNAESITTDVLSFQLLVVVVAIVGGFWPAILAAVLSGLTLDFLFIEPLYTVHINRTHHLLALVLYVVIASLVSFIVDRSARFTRAARRAAAESELIQTIAGSVLRGENSIQAILDRAREAFQLPSVVLRQGDRVVASAGDPPPAETPTSIVLTRDATLDLYGPDINATEQRLLGVVVVQLTTALEHEQLTETAKQIEPIAASDRVRGALLSALSHDLRRPLAAATAAIGGLKTASPELSLTDKQELLDTADESLTSLATLVTDLLDVSRLQADAMNVRTFPIDPADAIAPALEELGLGPRDVVLSLDHGDANVDADPVLLQRVVVNLLSNAQRYTPAGIPVLVGTSVFGDRLEIRVADRGHGIPAEKFDDVFQPFQRLGDTDNSTGLGLGLALSRGFVEAMRGTLTPEDTPGGGLTMVVSLPIEGAATGDGAGAAGAASADADAANEEDVR
ncbi:sensor histidine kinase KdpD [Leucobacter sp. cx-328]|uniref:ATP-binding protein n=1 Tax=unclassified Leucobacter TaxID=2621730 RepID=UPI00165D3537|nr:MULTISPECIES: ATP-binding protein [unclassified Leucobacter]MBC9944341.1 sensor histidine kinase KdpD [Leucobacter sp. cx-328]